MSKGFDEQLGDILSDYSKDLHSRIDGLSKAAAEETVKELRATSPIGHRKKLKRSWKISESTLSGLSKRYTVYSTRAAIAHLVENGHLTRDGVTRTKGSHFMEAAALKIVPQYEKAVEEAAEE